MSNRPLYALLLLLLALLAAATAWLEFAVQTHRLGNWPGGPRSPDYMIRHFVVTRTNLSGKVEYVLHADFAQHFSDDDTATLTLPHLVAQDAQQGSVDVRSDRAYVTAKAKEVDFFGHVVLVRDMHDGQGPLVLTTDYLQAFPDDQILRTTHALTIVGRALHLTARGMVMNDRTRQLHLLQEVKGQYEPARATR